MMFDLCQSLKLISVADILDLRFSLPQKDYTFPILQNGHLLNLPLTNKCLYYKKDLSKFFTVNFPGNSYLNWLF